MRFLTIIFDILVVIFAKKDKFLQKPYYHVFYIVFVIDYNYKR